MAEIMAGRSMNIQAPAHRFLTSAIVGGTLPIAVGVAAALKRLGSQRKVWCFVGDMCASSGAFHEALQYADGQSLPIYFVIEDNGLSTNTPTAEAWGTPAEGPDRRPRAGRYVYKRTYPHVGVEQWVQF